MDYSCPYCKESLVWMFQKPQREGDRETVVCPHCKHQLFVNRHWGHYLAAKMLLLIPGIPFAELFLRDEVSLRSWLVVGLLALACLLIWRRVSLKYREARQYEKT